MPFGSQSGQVGFGIQGSKGVAVAASRFARLRSGSLGGDRSLLIPDAEIGGNRDIPSAYLGPVSFSGDFEFYPRPQILALLMRSAFGSVSSANVAGTNEVQTITVTGTPTAGSFTVVYDGVTSGAIAFNATSTAVQTALQAMGNIGSGNVTCTGGPLGTAAVTVTFTGSLAGTNVSQFTLGTNSMTGGTTPTATFATTTPGVGQIGTHTITPADTLPWLTVEERIGNQFESFRYTDAKVNSLRIEAEASGYLMGSTNIIAISQTSGFTAQATPSFDATPMMVGGQVVVKFGGTQLPARSFNFEVNNNLDTDDFRLGSITLGNLAEKRREIKMGVSYRPDDALLWKGAMYGSSSATAPATGPAYQGAVDITITSFETIGNVTAGTPYSINIAIPYCAIAPFKISPSGDDVLTTDLELTPLRPNSGVPIATVTIVNNLATVS